jgi:hypothetical protein
MRGGTKFEFKSTPNLPTPSPYPLVREFEKLSAVNPRNFVRNATTFLSQYGVNKPPRLPYYAGSPPQAEQSKDYPAIFFIGNPYVFVREVKGEKLDLVVSQVWNRWIDGWGRLYRPVAKYFTDRSVDETFYDGQPGRQQYWAHKQETANVIFNQDRALYSDDGIFLNTHQPGFPDALFHEIFHAFESGNNLSETLYFAEGFAEYFAVIFANDRYQTDLSVFSNYAENFADAARLVRQTAMQLRVRGECPDDGACRRKALTICAQAVYQDDQSSLLKLLPMFDGDLREMIPEEDRLSATAVKAGKTVDFISARVHDPNRKEQSWYTEWRKTT